MQKTKILTISGGTGGFTILKGLKLESSFELTSILPSTDSGGSTGRLRDEFGYLPLGDIRQALVALAENQEEETVLRKLFMYRFSQGTGLSGHNFGNLLLTALTDIYGSELAAIEKASELLNVVGKILPVTLDKCELVAEYENGSRLVGEHLIDEPPYPHDGRLHITDLKTEPKVETYNEVKNAIQTSEYILIGPGDLYTSILANIVIKGVKEAIINSSAKIIYIPNLVTKFGQTYGFKLGDHVFEIEKYIGKKVDIILQNNSKLPEEILTKYKSQNDFEVIDDMQDSRVIRADLLADEQIKQASGDILKRSLIRHDGEKIKHEILKIVQNNLG